MFSICLLDKSVFSFWNGISISINIEAAFVQVISAVKGIWNPFCHLWCQHEQCAFSLKPLLRSVLVCQCWGAGRQCGRCRSLAYNMVTLLSGWPFLEDADFILFLISLNYRLSFVVCYLSRLSMFFLITLKCVSQECNKGKAGSARKKRGSQHLA